MQRRGNLFVVSGPTAAGKGTICAKLCERRADIKLSVSCATRAPRKNEVDGVHYFFVSNERFDEMVRQGELLEHANVHGNQYGTPKSFVMEQLDKGFDVILEIDVQGGAQVLQHDIDLTPVFVLPPSKAELINRLRSRGTETEEQIQVRLQTAAKEIKRAEDYPYLIVNDDLELAIRKLEAIIDASHASHKENAQLLARLHQEFQED